MIRTQERVFVSTLLTAHSVTSVWWAKPLHQTTACKRNDLHLKILMFYYVFRFPSQVTGVWETQSMAAYPATVTLEGPWELSKILSKLLTSAENHLPLIVYKTVCSFIFRCSSVDGQCECKPNMVGNKCSDPAPGYFLAPLDFYIYEAENAAPLVRDCDWLDMISSLIYILYLRSH